MAVQANQTAQNISNNEKNTKNQDFLCEILCEELPPKSLLELSNSFADEVCKSLTKLELTFSKCKIFAAPRRFAILISNLAASQPSSSKIIEGPNVKAAFDAAGNPTNAVLGFIRKFNIELKDLDKTGPKVSFTQNIVGKETKDLLAEVINDSLAKLPIAKRMRSGLSRAEFVRPVKSVLMLYGEQVIAADILDCRACDQTVGHRFHHPQAIRIVHPQNYASSLEKVYVIADFAGRKEQIRKQITKIANDLNAIALIPDNLLDEVTALVEYPQSILCNFAPQFLQVPQEALITTMQDNQKYFCLVDKQGKLLPHFITVANIASKDAEQIALGNQKVVNARLSDAQFFFEQDKKVGLEQFNIKLEQVTFQIELGSMLAKAQRVAKLAQIVAHYLAIDEKSAYRAGLLCKADLVSSMVGEFPELQGIAGSYYALAQGESKEISTAIYEHYQPRFAGDNLPSTKLGAAVSLADKIDTIVSIFGIGLIPTGSKDPYALRRGANGILRIILHYKLDIAAQDLLAIAQNHHTYPAIDINHSNIEHQICDFLADRLWAMYREQNIDPTPYLKARKFLPKLNLYDLDLRIQAFERIIKTDAGTKIINCFKRINNLDLTASKDCDVNRDLLVESTEKQLYQLVLDKQKELLSLVKNKKYPQLLSSLLPIADVVEQFLNDVVVNVDDDNLRFNRLNLLAKVMQLFKPYHFVLL